MEKENKRHRDAGRREFNDTVKVQEGPKVLISKDYSH